MTLHKLTAGNGYTYLTHQVAVNDAPAPGYANLAEYYDERGESPGVWLGRGLAFLPDSPNVGDLVSEEQMVSLFGHGRHPSSAVLNQRASAVDGADAITRLGTPFTVRGSDSEFRQALAVRISEHNLALGKASTALLEPDVRAQLRTDLGREFFLRDHDRLPTDARELTDYLTSATRRGASSTAGYDLTFSPVKSVSALWALAPPATAAQVEAAHNAAVRDVIGWLEDTAVYTRLGHNGTRQVDVDGLLAVAFVHRDSRTGDPDLHTHVAISNKVRTADGRWRALDGRVLYKGAVSASERYNTRLEAQLIARLGVEFADRPAESGKRPVREIVGFDPVLLQVWSSRRRAITDRQEQLAADFTRAYGRQPDAGESHDLFGQANLSTRPGKHGPRSQSEQRATWRDEAQAVLGGDVQLDQMLTRTVGTARRATEVAPVPFDWAERTAARAVATVASSRATWQVHHVRAEIERVARQDGVPLEDLDASVQNAVTSALGTAVSIRLGSRDDGVDEPRTMRRRDGSSVFTVSGAQLYTSAEVLAAESRLLCAADRTDGRRVADGLVKLSLLEARASGRALNPAQEELVRELATSGRRVQLALAPAGTGKTTALGALASAWREDGGTVVGLAPSAVAAAELRDSLGGPTDTIAKLLHGLDVGGTSAGLAGIGELTLVVIDEAGMAGTFDLDRTVAHVLGCGASVRLVGDDRQLAAVGSGGVLRDIARTYGAATLSSPVRFVDPTEGYASLALRTGDPDALGYYVDRGRVHAGDRATILNAVLNAWCEDGEAGREAVMLAASNELVFKLNQLAQAKRGSVKVPGAIDLRNGSQVRVDDLIVTRHNDRRLPISATDWVKNGDRWRVAGVGSDGSLEVVHLASRRSVQLPTMYVERHVELGYATTIHLAQGRTTDSCHTVLTGRESRQDLYVAMTRGRDGNHVYVDTSAPGPHDATTPDAIAPPTSGELLERVLARDSSRHSATSQRLNDASLARQLNQAVVRYTDAVSLADGESRLGVGPLPWLPVPPEVDDEVWMDYLHCREQLVVDLASRISGDDLAGCYGEARLRKVAPELAQEVAVWRAATGYDGLEPCGPPLTDAPVYRNDLAARVHAVIGPDSTQADQWRQLAQSIEPRLVEDPAWASLARAIGDASKTGYDVESRVLQLVDRKPLPAEHPARALMWRLADDCPESIPRPPTSNRQPDVDRLDKQRRRDIDAARHEPQPQPTHAARTGPAR